MARDWFLPFLQSCVRSFSDAEAHERLDAFRTAQPGLSDKEFIRRYIEHRLRERGIVYGTPLASEETITQHTQPGWPQRRAAFLASLQAEVELSLEVGCAVAHCTEGNTRVGELLVSFALFCRRLRLARRLHRWLQQLPVEGPVPWRIRRLAARLGRLVSRRAYAQGNPLLGLPVHNSFAYNDAKTLCRMAIAYFETGRPERDPVARVWEYQDRERELLLRAMLGLSMADRPLGVGSRRVMIDQIRAARLSWRSRRSLLKALRAPISPLAVAAVVRDDRTRDFLLEQVLLGGMLDGHFSAREWNFVADLATWLEVSPEQLATREAEVVGFYEKHRAYLDLFTVGSAVRGYRQRMLDRLQRAIAENLDLIEEEIRAKGVLGEQLARASLGERLSADEWRSVRHGLLDVLRSVPSLAIFTLPGGAVLLPLVFKLLPPGLKPRAFAERDRRRDSEGGGGEDVL